MNTATLSIDVVTPLKALWRWLVTSPGQTQESSRACPSIAPGMRSAGTTVGHGVRSQAQLSNPCAVRRPLRMVRVMEAGQTPAQVGRMVISGRMADVCAELDRLAACEARLH